MRQIKASEVKPGMKIEWTSGGVLHRLTPNYIVTFRSDVTIFGPDVPKVTGYNLCTEGGGVQWVSVDQAVTVLAEPQPEEPTEFGALRWVGDRCFVRLDEAGERHLVWYEKSRGVLWGWEDLCKMGPVTVVPDQGWTVPDTTEVPERIEEWPDDDTALRAHKWRDVYGDVWVYVDGAWRWGIHPYGDYETPIGDPWTRVTDA